MEANDEREEAYNAVCQAGLEVDAEDVPVLSKQQRADVEKMARECKQRSKFGEAELAVQVAESECGQVSSVKPDTSIEAYEFMLQHLESLINAEAQKKLTC